jgi:hypothetical protein
MDGRQRRPRPGPGRHPGHPHRPPPRLRRCRERPSSHPRHPVPGRLAQQVVHRPGRAPAGRGRPRQPRRSGRGLPARVHRGRPGPGRQDHRADAAQPDQRHGRRRVPQGGPAGGADHARRPRDQPTGGQTGERAGDGLPLLRSQLRGPRPPGRGGRRPPLLGLPPQPRPQPAGHDRDHQRRDRGTGALGRPRPGPGPHPRLRRPHDPEGARRLPGRIRGRHLHGPRHGHLADPAQPAGHLPRPVPAQPPGHRAVAHPSPQGSTPPMPWGGPGSRDPLP